MIFLFKDNQNYCATFSNWSDGKEQGFSFFFKEDFIKEVNGSIIIRTDLYCFIETTWEIIERTIFFIRQNPKNQPLWKCKITLWYGYISIKQRSIMTKPLLLFVSLLLQSIIGKVSVLSSICPRKPRCIIYMFYLQ